MSLLDRTGGTPEIAGESCASFIGAAQGARQLAELGARVIRIESINGDALRRQAPFLEGQPGLERSLSHLLYNAGKESVALALDGSAAWDAVDRLSDRADLVRVQGVLDAAGDHCMVLVRGI